MTGGFWARRRPGLVIAGGLVLLAAITVLLLRAERGPDLVAVLGFPLRCWAPESPCGDSGNSRP